MADFVRRTSSAPQVDDEGSSLDGLLPGGKAWTVLAWGCAATAAIGMALAAAYSEPDRRIAQAEPSAADAQRTVVPAKSVPLEAEAEARRLNEAVRILTADRDRLMARVAALERNLDDVTGSIAASGVAPRAAHHEPPNAPVPAGAGSRETAIAALPPAAGTGSVAAPTAAAPGQAAVPAAPDTPGGAASMPPASAVPFLVPETANAAFPPVAPSGPVAAPPLPSTVMLAPMTLGAPPAEAKPAAEGKPGPASARADSGPRASVATRTEFGVDLGGSSTVEGLRALWASLKETHEPLLGDLRPVIGIRESTKTGSIQLRLVAGPLSNASAAARVCAALAATGSSCRTTIFDGQRLALR